MYSDNYTFMGSYYVKHCTSMKYTPKKKQPWRLLLPWS